MERQGIGMKKIILKIGEKEYWADNLYSMF